MSIYTENGYKDYMDYLESLAEEHGLPYDMVYALYKVLGDEEAFDGLVTACQDAALMVE